MFQQRRITLCDEIKQNIFGPSIKTETYRNVKERKSEISETERALHEIRIKRTVDGKIHDVPPNTEQVTGLAFFLLFFGVKITLGGGDSRFFY